MRIREIGAISRQEVEKEKQEKQYFPYRVPKKMRKSEALLNDLFDKYANQSSAVTEIIKKSITEHDAWYLYGFGISMATYSLRHFEQRYFTNGLRALSLASNKLDMRDIWLVLSLYWNASKEHAFAFDSLEDRDDSFSFALKEYLNSDICDKSFEAMGYVIRKTEDGLTYIRTW